ncbi:MAG: sigma-70 family RNA polymerase sigma factor [Gelidibacter sp.]|nr:sigma-70 family RNA polymerase sigma factor [Gelidibacter sp.]
MRETYKIDLQTQLIEAIKANDSVVLKTFYTTNYYKVEALVLKNNGTKEHAKDIYQDAFIAVWNNIKNDTFIPQNESALQGYLYQIAKNKWMDVLRSSQFKKTKFIDDTLPLTDATEEQTNENISIEKQKLKHTMAVFKTFGSPCKELLTAFYFEKESLRDIAKKLQIEETTARNKKYRCMEKLRELILASKS